MQGRLHGLGHAKPQRQRLLQLLNVRKKEEKSPSIRLLTFSNPLQLLPRTSRPPHQQSLLLRPRPIRNQHGRRLRRLVPHDPRHRPPHPLPLRPLPPLHNALHPRLPRPRARRPPRAGFARHGEHHARVGAVLPVDRGDGLLFACGGVEFEAVAD